MKVFSLPARVEALIFDIDNTLYRNDEYCALQVDLLVKRFAGERCIPVEEAYGLIEERKRGYKKAHRGKSTSTGNIMVALGVPIEVNARWRDELFEPERYLRRDDAVIRAIADLSETYRFAAVTNNTKSIAKRTLACLGILEFFPRIVALDTCYVSKPASEPYKRALEMIGTAAGTAVSIGDRYDVDIEIPLALGMGGVLVEELEDLQRLQGALGSGTRAYEDGKS